MTIYKIDPLRDPRWPELCKRHPQASVFHTVGWLEALHRTYGYEPVVFTTSRPRTELENGVLFCKVNSFNRPYSPIGCKIKEALDSQSGPALYNWFVVGHQIEPGHWYHKEEEGGRILGNFCHWTDFVYTLMPAADRYPIRIQPTRLPGSGSDLAVSYAFGDGSVAVITFSAKGHTFEGVRERLSVHRGDVLISMSDFKQLTIENVEKKRRHFAWFRDHGHRRTIELSYAMCRTAGATFEARDTRHVWETAELFLATRTAVEQDRAIVLQPFSEGRLENRQPLAGRGSD